MIKDLNTVPVFYKKRGVSNFWFMILYLKEQYKTRNHSVRIRCCEVSFTEEELYEISDPLKWKTDNRTFMSKLHNETKDFPKFDICIVHDDPDRIAMRYDADEKCLWICIGAFKNSIEIEGVNSVATLGAALVGQPETGKLFYFEQTS